MTRARKSHLADSSADCFAALAFDHLDGGWINLRGEERDGARVLSFYQTVQAKKRPQPAASRSHR